MRYRLKWGTNEAKQNYSRLSSKLKQQFREEIEIDLQKSFVRGAPGPSS